MCIPLIGTKSLIDRKVQVLEILSSCTAGITFKYVGKLSKKGLIIYPKLEFVTRTHNLVDVANLHIM